MTVEINFTLPGLFDADTAVVAEVGIYKAIAVNKTMVITDSKSIEEFLGDTDYLVSNVELLMGVDEVIDMTNSGIDTEDGKTRAFQMAAQLVLIAGEPGPRAVRYLERVVGDDDFAARQVGKGEVVKHNIVVKATA